MPTIGLEIHAELKTKTKMFCDSLNDPRETHPNINVCEICMGHPGTLPVPNKKAIEEVVRVGYALNCTINEYSKFDRKNYFYPDLPKGYQISQYDIPFCQNGYLNNIRIRRIHLEEDTGKLQHSANGKSSFVDFNRAGVPLMELVTEPDIKSGKEAREFAEELRLILRYLGASNADMEKGQMRVEVNISLLSKFEIRNSKSLPAGRQGETNSNFQNSNSQKLGTKVEIKNLNSFRAVERATAYEIKRQSELLDREEQVIQETRGWDESKQETFSQREKEEAHDYRYFPEPDIPPMRLTKDHGFDLLALKNSIPELPQTKRQRFLREYKMEPQTAEVFVQNKLLADFYENAASELANWERPHEPPYALATNYIVTNLRPILEEEAVTMDKLKISPENFAELIFLIHDEILSSRGAKEILREMVKSGQDPHRIMSERGLKQVSEAGELENVIARVLKQNPGPAEDYKKGKEAALQFLVGQVMRETKGAANPQVAAEVLKKKFKTPRP